MKCSAMLPSNSKNALTLVVLVASPVMSRERQAPVFAATPPVPIPAASPTGAIFQAAAYTALTSGARASRVGDVLTVILTERMAATKTNAASTGRDGGIGLTPPTTGPLSVLSPSDIKFSGNQSFKGKGEAAQSNALSGEVSVTIAVLYPNGTALVRGEKQLTLNRGEERVQVSGIVRLADIAADNRVASTRLADARILYTGKGEIARASRQGWLQRFFSKVSPF